MCCLSEMKCSRPTFYSENCFLSLVAWSDQIYAETRNTAAPAWATTRTRMSLRSSLTSYAGAKLRGDEEFILQELVISPAATELGEVKQPVPLPFDDEKKLIDKKIIPDLQLIGLSRARLVHRTEDLILSKPAQEFIDAVHKAYPDAAERSVALRLVQFLLRLIERCRSYQFNRSKSELVE